MRREHRRPRIVGSVRLGGSSFVGGGLEYVVWRFAFVSFWFLSVLGGSWHFLKRCGQVASCQTTFAIYKSYCKEFRNALKNDTKIHQKSCKIHPKSTKMVPRSAQKATLGVSRLKSAKKGAKSSYKFEIIGATLAISGAILAPAGRQGGPKI